MTDVSPDIRRAIMSNTYITSRIGAWRGDSAVFTRLPIPEDAPMPCVTIPFNAATTDQDALIDKRTVIVRNVMVYGNIAAPGDPNDHVRRVDEVAFEIRRMFHRNRESLGNTPYHVIDIVVNGPNPAPVDDDRTVGRMVTLTMRIQDGS